MKNSTGVGTNYLYFTRVWDQSRWGYTIFLNFSGVHPGAPRCTPVHPGRGSEVGCHHERVDFDVIAVHLQHNGFVKTMVVFDAVNNLMIIQSNAENEGRY